MWAGRLPALVAYGLAMTDAWTALGRADTVRPQLREFAPEVDGVPQDELEMPRWLGSEPSHLAHRSNLLRKDPEFYAARFGDVDPDLPDIRPDP